MISKTRNRLAAVGAGVLVAVAAGNATAATQGAVQPQTVPGQVIGHGADGAPHTLMCPPEESAMGGGYAVSAGPGQQLDKVPADVLESRPTADATGWVIAVRKDVRSGAKVSPANLTVYVVCTQGENTPGG